ncbi:hypothetical protein R3P38DRAFT_3198719 [Favolaschia claudopus]|uniref:Uncharacterized protein n=1 Tax=Favolaschia claudopus TaxID=2862362 RepID=A0AAW0B3T0_9AGAR
MVSNKSTTSSAPPRRSTRNSSIASPASRGPKVKGRARGGAPRAGPGRDSVPVPSDPVIPELLDDDPLAQYWAPFDNDDARLLVTFFDDPSSATPDEEQLKAINRLKPMLLDYRKDFNDIPDVVETFLVCVSDVVTTGHFCALYLAILSQVRP